MSLEDISIHYPPPTWEDTFKRAMPELKAISDFLKKQGRYYPENKNIFKAFWLTPINKVKVVIVGQDPYHTTLPDGRPKATGLSFSVRRDDHAVPPSLKNIYKELEGTVEGFVKPAHGCLDNWAIQGVLMLNKCLTVLPGKANSHGKLRVWGGFIDKVLEDISASVSKDNEEGRARANICFLLWGKDAQTVEDSLGDRSVIFTASHPSPLSAQRGFFNCRHFPMVNEYLISKGCEPINWCDL